MSLAMMVDRTVAKYGSFTNKYSRLVRCQNTYLHVVAAMMDTCNGRVSTTGFTRLGFCNAFQVSPTRCRILRKTLPHFQIQDDWKTKHYIMDYGVCVYVYMHVCMCMYVCVNVCTCVSVCVNVSVGPDVRAHTCKWRAAGGKHLQVSSAWTERRSIQILIVLLRPETSRI